MPANIRHAIKVVQAFVDKGEFASPLPPDVAKAKQLIVDYMAPHSLNPEDPANRYLPPSEVQNRSRPSAFSERMNEVLFDTMLGAGMGASLGPGGAAMGGLAGATVGVIRQAVNEMYPDDEL